MAAKKNPEVIEVEVEEVTFSAKDLATELNTDPKTFRRWCRANLPHEKGSRWEFTSDLKTEVLERFRSTPEVDQDEDEG
jgi:ribosome-binding protein aMBF1 (putative translation factor)